jgi:hypothetical protein
MRKHIANHRPPCSKVQAITTNHARIMANLDPPGFPLAGIVRLIAVASMIGESSEAEHSRHRDHSGTPSRQSLLAESGDLPQKPRTTLYIRCDGRSGLKSATKCAANRGLNVIFLVGYI